MCVNNLIGPGIYELLKSKQTLKLLKTCFPIILGWRAFMPSTINFNGDSWNVENPQLVCLSSCDASNMLSAAVAKICSEKD